MPEYFEWQESYSVGVRDFDDTHKKLIGIINCFVTASMENQPLDQLTEQLTDLIRYTRHHFRDEEDLMKETGYALFDEHRAHHDALFEQVMKFNDDFLHGRIDKSKITEFMMGWLLTHIMEEDMRYREHFTRLGIH